jgi:DNA-binding transcriptional MerR regulator
VSTVPSKEFYKLSEVCQYTDTQPYVIRFWESEFPQLGPDRGETGQRLYRREDIDLVRRIKQLLYEQEFTIAGARKVLEDEHASTAAGRRAGRPDAGSTEVARPDPSDAGHTEPSGAVHPHPAGTDDDAMVSRRRYEDAIDEIDHLRLRLKEAERLRRRAEAALEEARRTASDQRARAERAAERLEQLLQLLA